MGIKKVNNIEELNTAIEGYSKDVKSFIVIAMKPEEFSVTLNYLSGKLNKVTCASKHGIDYSDVEKQLFNMAPQVIAELSNIETASIFGYGYREGNLMMFDFTDLDLESQQIEYYADKLEILKAWGINTIKYERVTRRVTGNINEDVMIINNLVKMYPNHNIFVIAEKKKNLQEFDSDFPILIGFK